MRFNEFNENSPAMQAALDAIDATFSPERKKINDRILDLRRAADMLSKGSNRAEKYMADIGVSSKEDLIAQLQAVRKSELEAAKDERIKLSVETSLRGIELALKKLGMNEQELKITQRTGSKVKAGDGVEIDLDQVDVEIDPATKKTKIKPKGTTPGQQNPKDMIKPGQTVELS
jgi:hypothetical protein